MAVLVGKVKGRGLFDDGGGGVAAEVFGGDEGCIAKEEEQERLHGVAPNLKTMKQIMMSSVSQLTASVNH